VKMLEEPGSDAEKGAADGSSDEELEEKAAIAAANDLEAEA
jgi:hypothetical protein